MGAGTARETSQATFQKQAHRFVHCIADCRDSTAAGALSTNERIE